MNTLHRLHIRARAGHALALAGLLAAAPAQATTPLADQPVFSNLGVPGNLALALSVEFPTVINAAYAGNFSAGTRYLGYFDPLKCYRYKHGNATHDGRQNTTDDTRADEVSHFYPVGNATSSFRCTGTGLTDTWSGSFLNWMTMQSIDSFRWALTGGYRRVDSTTMTVLERAWSSNQGNNNNFPFVTGDGGKANPGTTAIAEHTPMSWGTLRVAVRTHGNQIMISGGGITSDTFRGTALSAATHLPEDASSLPNNVVYRLYVRVRVCDDSSSAGGLEANCTAYPAGTYKPTGLIHQYANRFRYSAFGYLNDDNIRRDGGVLRARQKFVGPQEFTPGSPPSSNAAREWDPDTGIYYTNPDSTDATATNTFLGLSGTGPTTVVQQSGVINYLNKFGQTFQGNHKTHDPVGELYYAAVRYFKALGNITEWTAQGTADAATKARRSDGFPVITTWNDPIEYSCQRNFVLGIGDVNSHADKNVPGTSIGSTNEPARPAGLSTDPTDARVATDKVGVMEGLGTSLGTTEGYNGCCNNNSALMAGIAYDVNTRDIRPDVATQPKTKNKQTIQTYWLDVLEYGVYKNNNQFYLAAKYGGFRVPEGFDPYASTAALEDGWWYSTTDLTPGGQKRPDNYFTAADPAQMISGLTRVFKKASDDLKAFTTSFATALPQTALEGNVSFGAKFDTNDWTGEVVASTVTFDAESGTPSLTEAWQFSNRLTTQLAEDAGTGWSTQRRMVTWRLTSGASAFLPPSGSAVAFRHTNLSSDQRAALDTIYRTGDDSSDYLNYLRGDKTHEENSTVSTSAKIYRNRPSPVGDIVGSRVRPVGPPSAPFAAATNPGYAAFKSARASRPTIVYVGSNAGMLHAIDAGKTSTLPAGSGRELFAYVPDMLFQGPTGTPAVNGLASRGDPEFSHKPLVDGSPAVFDIDFARTQNNARTGLFGAPGLTPDWRTVLVGAMGKGGRGYFAIDVTNPLDWTSESAVAGKVLWEISAAHPDFAELGYTFGEPTAVKTRKWGWVLIFASGYNNSDGRGWFFIVNPRTGALLEKVSTGEGSTTSQAGMAHVQSFVVDRTDGTADAVYAGDLLGNLWRWDLRATTGDYPAPVKLAVLTNASNQTQPVTSRPLVVVHPATNRRYVTVGTGRLLDNSDILSTVAQSFYAVMDGTGATFSTSGPSGAPFPITRSQLVQHTDLTRKVEVPSDKRGWWVNLGVDSGNAWRVIAEPSAFFGVVTWVAMLPEASACEPSGRSRVFSVDVFDGQSRLVNASDVIVAYSEVLDGVVIDQRTYSVAGNPRLVACNDQGTCEGLRRQPLGNIGLRRLNWRELPLAD